MALSDFLNTEAIHSRIQDGWYQTLSQAFRQNVPLKDYEEAIRFNVNNGASSLEKKFFPIVFHAVVNDESLLLNFNVITIIKNINKAFAPAQIVFQPIIKTPDGLTLSNPGLNIIDGTSLVSNRKHKTYSLYANQESSYNHTYKYEGVALSDRYLRQGREGVGVESVPMEGYLLSDLYKNYAFNNSKVINIFLINDFSVSLITGGSKPMMMSSNPYVYDYLELTKSFNITIPFWALGNPDDHGFTYKQNTDADVHNIIAEGRSSIANTYISSSNNNAYRVLIKCLGHLFGLANTNHFNLKFIGKDDYGLDDINNTICSGGGCVYTDLTSEDFCGDCVTDTETPNHLLYTPNILNHLIEDNTDISCEDGNSFSAVLNYMTDAVTNDMLGDLFFSQNQITRMKANIMLNYSDGANSSMGILNQISKSDIEILNVYLSDCETPLLTNIENIIALNNSNSDVLFETTKTNIKNITNQFI